MHANPIVHDLRALFPVVRAAGKPRRSGCAKLFDAVDASPDDTIDDKHWTDICGANRMGIQSIRVKHTPPFKTSTRAKHPACGNRVHRVV